MYLMYVDESGDAGLTNSPTRYFVLSGLIIHELRWQTNLDILISFRNRMRRSFGLRLREEFHSSHMISSPGDLKRIKRNDRLTMIRAFSKEIPKMIDVNIINIVIDKQNKPVNFDVFEAAWNALIQRFENTISYRNFPGPTNSDERGFIFCDHTDDKKLFQMLRRMRRYNPIPHQKSYGSGFRNLPLHYIIEDPSFRDSSKSYFIQAVDLVAFLLYQRLSPNSYIIKKSAQNYFNNLKPVLCKVASSNDPDGIVWI